MAQLAPGGRGAWAARAVAAPAWGGLVWPWRFSRTQPDSVLFSTKGGCGLWWSRLPEMPWQASTGASEQPAVLFRAGPFFSPRLGLVLALRGVGRQGSWLPCCGQWYHTHMGVQVWEAASAQTSGGNPAPGSKAKVRVRSGPALHWGGLGWVMSLLGALPAPHRMSLRAPTHCYWSAPCPSR